MRCRALRSFVPKDGPPLAAGDEFDLPEGADYVAAGLAEPLAPKPKAKAKPKAPAKPKPKASAKPKPPR